MTIIPYRKTYTIIALLITYLIRSCVGLNNLTAVKNLLRNFEEKIDINFIYYSTFREQEDNPYRCSAAFGPSCKFINNRSLLDLPGYSKNNDIAEILDYKLRKEKVINYLDQVNAHVEQQAKLTKGDLFVLVSNEYRDSILGKNDKPPILDYDIDIYVNFNELPLIDKDSLVTDSYYQYYTLKNSYGGFKDQIPIPTMDYEHIQLTLMNVYQPDYKKIFTKKNIKHYEEYEKSNLNTEKINLLPYGQYLFSKDKQGEIIFSKPIKLKHIYMRKHNLLEYKQNRKKLGLDPNQIEFKITTLFRGQETEKLTVKSYHTENKWTRIKSIKNPYIDTLVFDENTDIDNLIFTVMHSDKSNLPENMKVIRTTMPYQKGDFFELKIPSTLTKEMKQEMIDILKKQWDDIKNEFEFDSEITFDDLLAHIEEALNTDLSKNPMMEKEKEKEIEKKKKK